MGTATDAAAVSSEIPLPVQRRVRLAASAMVLIALAFRTWAVWGDWFKFDDLAYLAIVHDQPLTWGILSQRYSEHFMPAAFALIWLLGHQGSLDYAPFAVSLLVMQLVASWGVVHLLRVMFGWRPGILPLLSIYLFSAITTPGFNWFAAGIQALPVQIAFAWGLAFHIRHLRTQGMRDLVLALAAVAFGLAFFEKATVVLGAIGIVTLGWFASGTLGERWQQVWRKYRLAVMAHLGLGAGYLGVYVAFIHQPSDEERHFALVPLIENMAGRTVATGLVGGPLEWNDLGNATVVANPPYLFVGLSLAMLLAIGVHLDRTRIRTRRAWLIPGSFLAGNLVLIGTARATLIGPLAGLEYRYVCELSLATAIGLGLAALPLVDAVEASAPARSSSFFDSPPTVAAVTAAVAVLGLWSSYQYTSIWKAKTQARSYFAQVDNSLGSATLPTNLIDGAVPNQVHWAPGSKLADASRILSPYAARMRFPDRAVDDLHMVDDAGKVRGVDIQPGVDVSPGQKGCTRGAGRTPEVEVSTPLIPGTWWASLRVRASTATDLTIRLADRRETVPISSGEHVVYFRAVGPAKTLQVAATTGTQELCVRQIKIGLPVPAPSAATDRDPDPGADR